MRQGYRVWDTHTHLGDALHSGRSMPAEVLLRLMDDEGIERALAIPFPVVASHRASHDLIAEACRTWPDRFTGCACIHPHIPLEEFHNELARCVEVLGFRALKLQPQYQPLNPLSPRSDFFFEAAQRWKLPVVV
ncbi:MAG TPA: amidohydrolase family protein, partial [Bryobacteraceae bacterium]|nr:amidohydrolase family protein [Bryobacteraceae bacterium]